MAWWKRLFGSSDADKAREKPAAEAPAGPVEEAPAGPVKEPTAEEELRPGLRARVYSCDLDSAQGLVPCWVYLSEGLAAFHEQKEIVFCLRRQSTEAAATDYPREILKFFGLLADMATEGDTVDLGETTEFSEAGLFEGSAHRALAYLPVIPLPGIPLPQRALLAILITQEELEVAKAFGLYRLSTRLGRRASHFPYPPWSGRHRASVVTPLMMLSSVLHPVPRLLLRGALHGHQGTTIRLSIARRLHNALRAQLEDRPADEALALLGDPRPEASARLVWEERGRKSRRRSVRRRRAALDWPAVLSYACPDARPKEVASSKTATPSTSATRRGERCATRCSKAKTGRSPRAVRA